MFDTLTFNDQWQAQPRPALRAQRGQLDDLHRVHHRAEHRRGHRRTPRRPGTSDDLFSYRAGLVYKPRANGSVYLALRQLQDAVEGVGQWRLHRGQQHRHRNCNVEPETAVNIELGTKWDLLDGRLALTAAMFRNERENYRVADPDPTNLTGEQQLDGKARVDGVTLGAVGD